MKLVVLISGRGSNLQAILDAGLPAEVVAVLSNRESAEGLRLAEAHGIATHALAHTGFASRAEFDQAMLQLIDNYAPDLVVLAGYMRILTDEFVQHYAGRLINIHPSLLPSYTGLNTHARALADGVKIHGCTVHLVTPTLDHGPVIVQAAVAVRSDDTAETLGARVLEAEHRIYPLAIRWFVENRLAVDACGKVNLLNGEGSEQSVFYLGA
ncbi:phosphoribosylglycinamide formyltransferase [Sulfuriferula thiophila]|uniref:phosphoribosylglycinamide formyltransferase n=1 Tax=Sulfuriferula thiophila TaxID=1781211 RepID=UPI000F6050DB|nr:phosphoribosylglycinamide formyltransferase [Sulfuriferula thiophila]